MDKSKFVIGIQVRSTSKRLPGKSSMKINKTALWSIVYSKCIDTDMCVYMLPPYGDDLVSIFKSLGIMHFEGPEESPLQRFMGISFPFEYVIRITGDCPLISTEMIVDMSYQFLKNDCYFIYNELDGFDIQIAKEEIFMRTEFLNEEHVFDMDSIKKAGKYTKYEPHLSIDTIEDYHYVKSLMEGR